MNSNEFVKTLNARMERRKAEQDAMPYTEAARDEAIAWNEKRDGEIQNAKFMRWRNFAEVAGVPFRILSSEITHTEAVKTVTEFMNGEKTLLVLAGGVGTGKSVASGDACGKVRSARFIKAMDLLRIGIYGEAAEKFARECKTVALLVIDDLGTEPRDEKGYAAANFEAAMDYRYDAQLKTILTTNLDFDAFKKRYCDGGGDRFMDRLREVGTFHGLTGKSLREKK